LYHVWRKLIASCSGTEHKDAKLGLITLQCRHRFASFVFKRALQISTEHHICLVEVRNVAEWNTHYFHLFTQILLPPFDHGGGVTALLGVVRACPVFNPAMMEDSPYSLLQVIPRNDVKCVVELTHLVDAVPHVDLGRTVFVCCVLVLLYIKPID
jgi:hypothetical protein